MSQLILIVEDDAEMRNIYRRTLERAGYEVVEARDGQDGLSKLEEHTPALLIVDMLMPNMNGAAFLERVRDNPEFVETPAIVITAFPRHRETAVDFAAYQFLTKPVRPNDILAAVRKALVDKPKEETEDETPKDTEVKVKDAEATVKEATPDTNSTGEA